MRDTSIARNYAEAALELAQREQGADVWGGFLHALADLVEREPVVRRFIAAPQVAEAAKAAVLTKAFGGSIPSRLLRFVLKVIANRRQLLFPMIAVEYDALRDIQEGRVHARVTVSRAISDADRDAMTAQLSKVLGKTVVPHTTVDAEILGGVIVRVGDRVMDGSVRRKLGALRAKLAR